VSVRLARAAAIAAISAIAMVTLLPVPVDAGLLSCTISTTSVSFGNYDVFTITPLDTTGTITYQCDFVVLPTITLSRGVSSTFNPRTMQSGAATLNYNLFIDAARLLIWGDGNETTQTYIATGSVLNLPVPVTVYARVPAQQDVSAGTYSDIVVATIHF
jgi:spore coat protein U-like protein